MATLSIDIETYSSVDIKKSGLYKYVQSPDFEILLFAYAYDGGPVQVVDLAQGETLPEHIGADLNRPEVIKTAYNAAFEYYCLSKFYQTQLEQWRCTMIHALYCGYPAGLAAVGRAMDFAEDKRKLATGQALIRYFCIPCKPTQTNGGRTRNYPQHDPERWRLFKEYCAQDVVTEREIKNRLAAYPMPEPEWLLYAIDQRINLHGVQLDLDLVDGALELSSQMAGELKAKAQELTGLDNPNSIAQLKAWVQAQAEIEVESLNKQTVAELLADKTGKDEVKAMLKIRQELGKTSVKKYDAMRTVVCEDGRVRGLLQFYGANRTGRWAGRLVQVQNLPRNHMPMLDLARQMVKERNGNGLQIVFGSVPDTLSQLIRTAFVPRPGCHFSVADFSAIEARVIAWLAGEQWRLEVFRTHGKIYEASASQMFGVPLERIKKGNPEYELRSKGKVAELALGYQGSKGALIKMGALRMGLPEEELPEIVQRWRASNRRIVDLWYKVEQAAVDCIEYGVITTLDHGVTFSRDDEYLFIMLPSGRHLFYHKPMLLPDERGREKIWFQGVDQNTKQWGRISAYGGKLVENIVQAIARDCLANSIKNLYDAGYEINFHIHDEVILEVPDDSGQSLDEAVRIMCRPPDWADGLPLNADGFDSPYYKKD